MLQVLIVEDLPANRAVAVFHLQKLGCQTQTAEDGQEALEKCQEQRFDLVFMDLEMPRMNGHYAL
ncbi:MAG: response regulator [Spirochaetaceae bacterium]|jgi:CheY-like chemotaxis protein|nr:response regulator [Spirochaetaceae bacterium]